MIRVGILAHQIDCPPRLQISGHRGVDSSRLKRRFHGGVADGVLQFEDVEWQTLVAAWIEEPQYVVMNVGNTSGVTWEFQQCVRSGIGKTAPDPSSPPHMLKRQYLSSARKICGRCAALAGS